MSAAPPPQGNYVPARRFGDMIFVSGMTPRENGVLTVTGRISAGDSPERYRQAIELATNNALRAAETLIGEGEALSDPLTLTVYLATEPDFSAHSALADFASAVLAERFGSVPSRAAVGVLSLPGGAPVEIALVMGVGRA